jgi:hypothetical protein
MINTIIENFEVLRACQHFIHRNYLLFAILLAIRRPLARKAIRASTTRRMIGDGARRQVQARELVFEHSPIDVALCDLRVGVKVIRTQSEQSSSGYPWEQTFSMK